MSSRARILIVDDETDFASAVCEFLCALGHDAVGAATGWDLDRLLGKAPADLIILDIGLPGESGLDILRRLPATARPPVILLTAAIDGIERVLGLETGADDYVTKPVGLRELAARVSGLLARNGRRRREVMLFEEVAADLSAARIIGMEPRLGRLSAGEVALLRAFADNPDRLMTRDALLQAAPAENREAFDRSIDSRIARLRRKLRTASIRTVSGHGYLYKPPR